MPDKEAQARSASTTVERSASRRLEFYPNHGIVRFARPQHGSSPGGLKHAGKFRKVSNMNYGTAPSVVMNSSLQNSSPMFLLPLHPTFATGSSDSSTPSFLNNNSRTWTFPRNVSCNWSSYQAFGTVYKVAAPESRKETEQVVYPALDRQSSDPSKVCFRDAANEMSEGGGSVVIIQHEDGKLRLSSRAPSLRERITHFIKRFNKSVLLPSEPTPPFLTVASRPFTSVSLADKAVQDASLIDEASGKRRSGTEATGYTLRWAAYSQGGSEGGVNLTGGRACEEAKLHVATKSSSTPSSSGGVMVPSVDRSGSSCSLLPLYTTRSVWPSFISLSGIVLPPPPSERRSTTSYSGSVLIFDRFYLHSFEIFLACVVVFPALGNLGFTLLEYRLDHRAIWSSATENLRWIPFLTWDYRKRSRENHLRDRSTAYYENTSKYRHLSHAHREDGHLHGRWALWLGRWLSSDVIDRLEPVAEVLLLNQSRSEAFEWIHLRFRRLKLRTRIIYP
ncbi:hypothetical protein GYMLUDRAFT_244547 [Collybiopsis luxurians FD-317 M1]|uniref:Uncharacterized protein n=1 Tax=Collybiopsis luxurians FD-317 M1 TaxID=944289 RepID=A0A0D0CN45_9AGAR|nr:hypothetical protein GYMLUDRAFT_244547 [Collybiopsis luxurians FD-317 M1]